MDTSRDIKFLVEARRGKSGWLDLPHPEDSGFDKEVARASEVIIAMNKLEPAHWTPLQDDLRNKILKGQAKTLSTPASYIEAFDKDGPGTDEDRGIKGYRFDWGDLVESSSITDAGSRRVLWEIRFSSLHREILATGGTTDELKDLAIDTIEKLLDKPGNSPKRYHISLFGEGLSYSTCATFLLDVDYADQEVVARKWIYNRLLGGRSPILAQVISEIRRQNTKRLPRLVRLYHSHLKNIQE